MTHYKLVYLLTFAILLQVCNVGALNILAIVSIPLKSHYMAFQRLFQELGARGHSVTIINSFPDENPPRNLKFIDVSSSSPPNNVPPITHFENHMSSIMHLHNLYVHFVKIGPPSVKGDCELFFNNKGVKALRERGEKFDVIFVEQFMSDCGLAFASVAFDAPIIGITSHTLLPWAYPRLGIPFDVGSNAFYFSPYGTNPSIYQKVESYFLNLYINTIGKWQVQRNIYEVFNKYLPNVKLDVENVARNRMKMTFVYQHHSITGARLLAPQLLEIGGIHIDKSKPVPEHIEKFMSSAKHGVVYVSFGTYLKASTMSKDKLNQFLLAFKKIPQKVLWKVDNVTFPISDDDLMTSDWFPQLDILCHPKVTAFVSHGGMLGMSEAAHCGKPMLAIPFFGDQFSNAAAVVESGLGLSMNFNHIHSESLAEAIKRLTSDEMQQSAKRVSKLWHDRPMDALDSAIYWTEYVARHKTAPPALNQSTQNTWFQNSLLDVYSIIMALTAIVPYIIYLICKTIKLIILSLIGLLKPENKQSNKTKKKRA